MLSKVRHRLGLLKYRLQAATIGKMLARRAGFQRAIWARRIGSLPPVVVGASNDPEVHMLCGRRDADMGVYASWSFARRMPVSKFFVHGDGTLHEEDLVEWRRVVPSVHLVDIPIGDALAEAALRDFPRLAAFRKNQLYGRKLIDVHLIGTAAKLVLMDSDVLCFRYPQEVHTAVVSKNRAFRWNRDPRNSYSATPDELFTLTGREPVLHFNAGFTVVPRFGVEEFALLDTLVGALASLDANHPWMEQTLYALMAATIPGSLEFGPEYNAIAGKASERQVLRHYVGSAMIRPLFFLEGVPRLARHLAMEQTRETPGATRTAAAPEL